LLLPPQDALRCELDIGVVCVDKHGGLAAQLQRDGGNILGGSSGDDAADAAAPSEKDMVPFKVQEGGSFGNSTVDDPVRRRVKVFREQVG
jgi:hypothetical protein